MQLSGANRRDVIEDLLDIRIFSAMNNLIKDNIRLRREKIKSLDLKKDNIKDKMGMQEKFIEEIEQRGKDDIKSSKNKIVTLSLESDTHMQKIVVWN